MCHRVKDCGQAYLPLSILKGNAWPAGGRVGWEVLHPLLSTGFGSEGGGAPQLQELEPAKEGVSHAVASVVCPDGNNGDCGSAGEIIWRTTGLRLLPPHGAIAVLQFAAALAAAQTPRLPWPWPGPGEGAGGCIERAGAVEPAPQPRAVRSRGRRRVLAELRLGVQVSAPGTRTGGHGSAAAARRPARLGGAPPRDLAAGAAAPSRLCGGARGCLRAAADATPDCRAAGLARRRLGGWTPQLSLQAMQLALAEMVHQGRGAVCGRLRAVCTGSGSAHKCASTPAPPCWLAFSRHTPPHLGMVQGSVHEA